MNDEQKKIVEENVVEICCKDAKGHEERGTGFYINKDILITAYHVVANYVENGDNQVELFFKDGSRLDKVVYTDQRTFCIFNVNSDNNAINPLKFKKGYPIKRGQEVIFFGYSSSSKGDGCWVSGTINTASKGGNPSCDWKIEISGNDSTYQGCSGSPVFIEDYLVGIVQQETTSNVGVSSVGFSSLEILDGLSDVWCDTYSFQDKICDCQKLGYKVYSIADKNDYLKKATKKCYAPLSVNFFESDDDEFKEKFHRKIDEHQNVYLSGMCEEETLYYALSALENVKDYVVVVEDENSWKYIEKLSDQWFVAVANFHSADGILPLEGKSSVFLYGDDDFSQSNDTIYVHRRARSFIEAKLWNIGEKQPSVFFERTHGFFYGIKREFFDGKFISAPLWSGERQIQYMVAVMLGKWTDCAEDICIIEELTKDTYDNFVSCMNKYTTGEEPFVLKFNGRNGYVNYHIVNFEQAWHYLFVNIHQEMWERFCEVFQQVMINPGYSSVSVQIGMMRTMTFYALHSRENQLKVNRITSSLLDNLKTKDDWVRFAHLLPNLCEVAPEIILKRIHNEVFKENSPIKEVFRAGSSASVYDTSSMAFVRILWSIEQLLYYRSCINEVMAILFELNSMGAHYAIGNTPTALLVKFFCLWKNFYPVTIEQKINLLKKYLRIPKYSDVWNIIIQTLPSGVRQCFIMDGCSPSYRNPDAIKELTEEEIVCLTKEYASLCLEYINGDAGRFEQILKKLNILSWIGVEFNIEVYQKIFKSSNDESKFSMLWSLRDEIYKNRFFKDANWKLHGSRIKILEQMLEQLTKDAFNNPYIYYLYWFQASSNYAILNPLPFDNKKHSDVQPNQKIREEELQTVMREFCDEQMDVFKLIETAMSNTSMFQKYNSGYMGNIGRNLVHFYPLPQIGFNESFYCSLIEKFNYNPNIHSLLYGYFVYGIKTTEFFAVMDRIGDKIEKYSLDLYVKIIAAYGLDNNRFIFSQSETVQKRYWELWNPYTYDSNDDGILQLVLSNLLSLKRVEAYVYVLYVGMEKMSENELLLKLVKVINIVQDISKIKSVECYLTEIINRLERENGSDEYRKKLGQIELSLAPVLDFSALVTLQKELAVDADMYGEIVKGYYKEDNALWWRLYTNCVFCPGVLHGEMNGNIFSEWVCKFKRILDKEDLGERYYAILGRLFAHSPMGSSSSYPCDLVRDFIEDINDDMDFQYLSNAYVTEIYNSRGIYCPDGGKGERELAALYRGNMERLIDCGYSKVAKLYEKLTEAYSQMSEEERERAEYES